MKKFKPLTWEKEPVLSKDLLPNLSSKDLPQEFSKLVDENFDELIGEEPKQETLEDAAECKSHHSEEDFIRGAKWQAERMYSEDEVRELLMKALTHTDYNFCGALVTAQQEIRTANFNVWFEEYKKK